MMRMLCVLVVLSVCTFGCGGKSPVESIVAPDASRKGTDGAMGPFGVASVAWTVPSRISEGIDVEVVFPATKDNTLDRSQAPYPAIVFVHGGLVPAKRYRWIAEHAASRGYVVIMPSHLADLAIFEYDNAWIGLQAVRREVQSTDSILSGAIEPTGKVVMMGHSLGGVIATWQWAQHPDVGGVALLASWPADDAGLAAKAGTPVLSLMGTNEPKATQDEARKGAGLFKEPVLFGLVKDMNHYDWTDGTTSSELDKDGPPSSDLPKVRRNVMRLLDAWLDASLRGNASAKRALTEATFAGIELSR